MTWECQRLEWNTLRWRSESLKWNIWKLNITWIWKLDPTWLSGNFEMKISNPYAGFFLSTSVLGKHAILAWETLKSRTHPYQIECMRLAFLIFNLKGENFILIFKKKDLRRTRGIEKVLQINCFPLKSNLLSFHHKTAALSK